MDLMEKLHILSDAAKYDVACTSSGSERKGTEGTIGNTIASGICHSFSADGRCISLLKILYTNHCIYDCKYCINRASNDIRRAAFTPEEICTLTMEFYRRNYIEGLFLSSGVWHTPNETMAELLKTLMLLREKYNFNGYIHCKAIPGASSDLLELAGWYADRMSVNIELPTAEGLKELAPHKNRKSILLPMRSIQSGIEENMLELGACDGRGRYWHTARELGRLRDKPGLVKKENKNNGREISQESIKLSAELSEVNAHIGSVGLRMLPEVKKIKAGGNRFVPAGQSTQMIVGATQESDYQILSVAEALYQKFDLKRVFYSAFVRVNDDSHLPVLSGGPPLRREHRLYQADWLLRYYGFEVKELLSEKVPNFNEWVEPKCDWAIRNFEQFPVEINCADYYTLLRVPGIGVRSARRIVKARSMSILDYSDLKKLGVVLKRAVYFITCNGKRYYPVTFTRELALKNILMLERLPAVGTTDSYQQLSLFDIMLH